MTKNEIILVQQSWKLLRGIKPEIIGDVFYTKLFIEAPVVRRLFRSPMMSQYEKLIAMISMIVGRLHQFEKVSDDIREMAKRHTGYGVKPEHYEPVGKALMWTIEKGLGSDWNEEIREAWKKCYQLMADTMIEAAD